MVVVAMVKMVGGGRNGGDLGQKCYIEVVVV